MEIKRIAVVGAGYMGGGIAQVFAIAGKLGTKQRGGFVIPGGDTTDLIAYRNTAYARLAQLLEELGQARVRPRRSADRRDPTETDQTPGENR